MWKRNLYCVWGTQIVSLIGFGLGMPIIPFYIQADLGIVDPAQINWWVGWLSGITGLAVGIMAPLWGLLADRIGRKLMILRALLAGSVILVLMGFAATVEQLFVLRIMQGVFCGSISAAATLVAAGTPKEKSGYALGFLSSSTFIGFTLGPVVGGLISDAFGYRASFRTAGVILLLAFVFNLIFVKEVRHRHDKGHAEAPPSSGKGGARFFFLFLASITPFLLMLFFLRMSRTLPNVYTPLLVQQLRGSMDRVASISGVIAGGVGISAAVSGVLLGRLGDRYDKMKLIIAAAFFSSVSVFCVYFAQNLVPLALFLWTAAFFAGGIEPLVQSTTGGMIPAHQKGLFFGIQTSMSSLGWFLAPLIGIYAVDNSGIPAVYLLSAVAYIFIAAIASAVFIGNRRKKPL